MKESSPKKHTMDQRPEAPKLQFKHAEEFASLYANNVQLEQSVWDLKMIFGELDQSQPGGLVEQHTAVSVSWIQAKLLSYFLNLHVEAHELVNGKIRVPDEVLPPEPVTPSGEWAKNPHARAVFELINRRREEFIASLGQ